MVPWFRYEGRVSRSGSVEAKRAWGRRTWAYLLTAAVRGRRGSDRSAGDAGGDRVEAGSCVEGTMPSLAAHLLHEQ